MSETDTAADRLTTDLKRRILRGEYVPGERLPPERELAEKLGLNRVTVRGALARLESMKLVTIRHGSGCVVLDYRRSGGLDLLGALSEATRDPLDSADIVRDLLDLRRALARMVLDRLAGRIDARGVAQITEKVNDLEELASANAPVAAIAHGDLEVFRAVVAATGSMVLVLCMNPISDVVIGLPGLAEAMYAEPMQNVMSYRLLLGWLPQGRPEMLEPIMKALGSHDKATLKIFEKSARRRRRS